MLAVLPTQNNATFFVVQHLHKPSILAQILWQILYLHLTPQMAKNNQGAFTSLHPIAFAGQ